MVQKIAKRIEGALRKVNRNLQTIRTKWMGEIYGNKEKYFRIGIDGIE